MPDRPYNLSVTNLSSTSLILNWYAGLNGGENETFTLNINSSFNVSIKNNANDELNRKFIEIKSKQISFIIIYTILVS